MVSGQLASLSSGKNVEESCINAMQNGAGGACLCTEILLRIMQITAFEITPESYTRIGGVRNCLSECTAPAVLPVPDLAQTGSWFAQIYRKQLCSPSREHAHLVRTRMQDP